MVLKRFDEIASRAFAGMMNRTKIDGSSRIGGRLLIAILVLVIAQGMGVGTPGRPGIRATGEAMLSCAGMWFAYRKR